MRLATTDHVVGSWKLNVSRSQGGALAVEQRLSIQQQGTDLLVEIHARYVDGSLLTLRYNFPQMGGDGRIVEGPFDGVKASALEGNRRILRYFKGGNEVTKLSAELSADGKTLRLERIGADGQLRDAPGTLVFERA